MTTEKTLTDQYQEYLVGAGKSANTVRAYTRDLAHFAQWFAQTTGDSFHPQAVDPREIQEYRGYLMRHGLAPATVNRRLAALSSFYHFLEFDIDGDVINPVLPRRHFISRGRHLPRDVEDDDVERLFAVIDSPCDRAVFLLMLRCGLRVQEVHRLSLGDQRHNFGLGKNRTGAVHLDIFRGVQRKVPDLDDIGLEDLGDDLQEEPAA